MCQRGHRHSRVDLTKETIKEITGRTISWKDEPLRVLKSAVYQVATRHGLELY